MASMIAPDSPFGMVASDWVERWGSEVVLAAGVLDKPMLLREADATGPTHDLDDEASWWDTLPADAAVEEFLAVRDLEQVRADALPELVALLVQPPLRSAVVEPAIVSRNDAGRLRVPSYTAWWLSTRPVLAGCAPRELRLAASDPELAALYDVAPAGFDDEFLRALGVLGSLADTDPDAVLARLADDRREVDRTLLRRINSWLAGQLVTPPQQVRAVKDGCVVVVDASDAVIVDAPDLFALLGNLATVPVPQHRAVALAERLDLPLASELADFSVRSPGALVDDAVVHERLRVADVDGVDRAVAWRLDGTTLHVDSERRAFGLGRGRAWRGGDWSQRHRLTEALIDPSAELLRDGEDDLDHNDEEPDGQKP
jgi:hypothetical protein